jgi:5-formyltetrahydrofolate cyclo-ligase
VPPSVRRVADIALLRHILRSREFRSARHVAVYLAFDGEPSLEPLFAAAAAAGKRLYAPVITRRSMHFAELRADAPLARNFFGIREPQLGRRFDARHLDLVLTPLVAFDDRGVRLGVGRGYYDRCFRFLHGRRLWQRPKLLAVAYELQRLPLLPRQSWDVPLYGAVTEAGIRRF